MYLVLIQAATTALTGGRLRWHKLQRAGLGGATKQVTGSDRIPAQSVAPVVDTWPPTLGQAPVSRHPAAGRALARPAVPPQPRPVSFADVDGEDLPSAGSPPAGGSGPVYTG
jgi:hypothetical protein